MLNYMQVVRGQAIYRWWRILWRCTIVMIKCNYDEGNENMQNVCQRHLNRLYAPIVRLNNIHQRGIVVLKFQCYVCHSSVVCYLRAPHTLNSHRVLKLFHPYSSYILISLACCVFTIKFTLLFFLLVLEESLFQRFLPFCCLRVTMYCIPVK
jgi:hypothetical protein